ncbi:MAG TPA: DEAD/DEAH box helicase, partial [Chthoniobacteraceae bacterium]
MGHPVLGSALENSVAGFGFLATVDIPLEALRMIARSPTQSKKASRPAGDLLDAIASAEPIADKLRALGEGEDALFEQVVESARAVLCSVIARGVPKRNVWVICPDVRTQEAIHNELAHWIPAALFFPELEHAPVEGAIVDPENAAERLAILDTLAVAKGRHVVVVTRAGLNDAVPSPKALKRLERRLTRGAALDRDKLIEQLEASGYEQAPQVALRGQYAVRGGILDVFSFQHTLPVRIEFFGDEIESIRQFDLDSQTSVQPLDTCNLLLEDLGGTAQPNAGKTHADTTLASYVDDEDITIDLDTNYPGARATILTGSAGGGLEEDYGAAFFDHGLGEFEAGDFVVDEIKRERFFGQLREWREQRWRVHVFCNNEGEIERLRDLIPAPEAETLVFTVGSLARGFTFPVARIAALSDAEIFGRYRNTRARRMALRRAREIATRAQIDFSELIEGELVVHLEHGIGRYEGMKTIPKQGEQTEEVLVVAFANEAKLYVPLEQSYLISRYVGIGKKNPGLSELGNAKWTRARQAAEKAVFDYAARLLNMHAERETLKGFAFAPDKKWQREFESSFLFKETPDQAAAITATKADMESERPMDRLICGDVGFGKTEVAIRAAFKAVMDGRQVAVLVPTTVLAQQHFNTFRERMADYPVRIELLSRFRTRGQQTKVIEDLAAGAVDIVIGTHRLIQSDVVFKDLGLVVIDEEQRFGVLHKEKFKMLRKLVDVLTLSATPIPRTLYLALTGARDMSSIPTPPHDRLPVETIVAEYDERAIRDAILRELHRGGQVFFL